MLFAKLRLGNSITTVGSPFFGAAESVSYANQERCVNEILPLGSTGAEKNHVVRNATLREVIRTLTYMPERSDFSYRSDPLPEFDDHFPIALMNAEYALCCFGARMIDRLASLRSTTSAECQRRNSRDRCAAVFAALHNADLC